MTIRESVIRHLVDVEVDSIMKDPAFTREMLSDLLATGCKGYFEMSDDELKDPLETYLGLLI
jgi:hypothetical protein